MTCDTNYTILKPTIGVGTCSVQATKDIVAMLFYTMELFNWLADTAFYMVTVVRFVQVLQAASTVHQQQPLKVNGFS